MKCVTGRAEDGERRVSNHGSLLGYVPHKHKIAEKGAERVARWAFDLGDREIVQRGRLGGPSVEAAELRRRTSSSASPASSTSAAGAGSSSRRTIRVAMGSMSPPMGCAPRRAASISVEPPPTKGS